ncbi:hypothetical protein ACLOJK_004863 [Asimina triloba]
MGAVRIFKGSLETACGRSEVLKALVHHQSTKFRCSIFSNRPPSDPPPARLRSTDRSRPENQPRRDDRSGRASTAGNDPIGLQTAMATEQSWAIFLQQWTEFKWANSWQLGRPWGTAPTTPDQQLINDQSSFRPDLSQPTNRTTFSSEEQASASEHHQRMYLHPISMDDHHDSSPLGSVRDEQQIDCSAPTPSRPNFGSKIGRKSQRGVAHPSKSSCPSMPIKETHPDINDHKKFQQASRQNHGKSKATDETQI